MSTLLYIIQQVWPNLAASAIWATPALVIHHKMLKAYLSAKLEIGVNDNVGDEPATGNQGQSSKPQA